MRDERRSWHGVFSVSPEQELTGTLSLNGEESVLHLWTNNPANASTLDTKTITGILDNQKRVSLIDCISIGDERIYGRNGVSQHYKFFPHYVIIGSRHFSKSTKEILQISFVIDDAAALFDDRTSFGTLVIPQDRIQDVTSLDVFEKIPLEGASATIAYWTGKAELFAADTEIGRVCAFNQPTVNMGGPAGAFIRNEIVINVEFSESVSVSDTVRDIWKLLRFIESIVGRRQNLLRLDIIKDVSTYSVSHSVYLNMYPDNPRGSGRRVPHSLDVLIDAAVDSDRFSRLLCEWLKREETWRIARSRFATGWVRGRDYDADRIVGAANMFDLLPDDALPPDSQLPEGLDITIRESRAAFEQLPASAKRDGVLGYLGRLKKPSLKEKIRYRASLVSGRIRRAIPDIDSVTDAAVDLRNVYVHGSSSTDTRKEKLQESMPFLTNTLEFVFCASDLIECGWDIETWYERPKGIGHPFAEYLWSYSKGLSDLLG